MSTPMIAITTRSSISVKPIRRVNHDFFIIDSLQDIRFFISSRLKIGLLPLAVINRPLLEFFQARGVNLLVFLEFFANGAHVIEMIGFRVLRGLAATAATHDPKG